jgi:hypothetical protein
VTHQLERDPHVLVRQAEQLQALARVDHLSLCAPTLLAHHGPSVTKA